MSARTGKPHFVFRQGDWWCGRGSLCMAARAHGGTKEAAYARFLVFDWRRSSGAKYAGDPHYNIPFYRAKVEYYVAMGGAHSALVEKFAGVDTV